MITGSVSGSIAGLKKFYYKNRKAIFLIILTTILFISLCVELIENELTGFDSAVYKFLTGLISEDMTDFMIFITWFGAGAVLLLVALMIAVIAWKRKINSIYTKLIFINLFSVSILNEIFKVIFHRERPDILRLVTAGGFSFPSGHSMISMGFYGFYIYLLYKNLNSRWKYLYTSLLSLLTILIGISRIYLGVHYASDVLAGFSAGLAWLAIFVMVVYRRVVDLRSVE